MVSMAGLGLGPGPGAEARTWRSGRDGCWDAESPGPEPGLLVWVQPSRHSLCSSILGHGPHFLSVRLELLTCLCPPQKVWFL